MMNSKTYTGWLFLFLLSFTATNLSAQNNNIVTIRVEKEVDGKTTITEETYELDSEDAVEDLLEDLGINDNSQTLNRGESIQIKVSNNCNDTSKCNLKINNHSKSCCNNPEHHEKKPFLGVTPAYDKNNSGVTIQHITTKSSAENIGLIKGDIITEMNGIKVKSFDDLVNIIEDCTPDEKISLKIIREGEIEKLTGAIGFKETCHANIDLDFSGLSDWAHDLEINISSDMESFEQDMESFGEHMEIWAQGLADVFENMSDESTVIVASHNIKSLNDKDTQLLNKNGNIKFQGENDLDLQLIKIKITDNNLDFAFKSHEHGSLDVNILNKNGESVFKIFEKNHDGLYKTSINLDGSDSYILQIVHNQKQYCQKILIKD